MWDSLTQPFYAVIRQHYYHLDIPVFEIIAFRLPRNLPEPSSIPATFLASNVQHRLNNCRVNNTRKIPQAQGGNTQSNMPLGYQSRMERELPDKCILW